MKLKNKLIWLIPASLLVCAGLIAGGIFLQHGREWRNRYEMCLWEGDKTFAEVLPDGSDFWRGYPVEHVTVKGDTVTVYRSDLDCRYTYENGALASMDLGGFTLTGQRSLRHFDVRDIASSYTRQEVTE